jgi:hypothetical protein
LLVEWLRKANANSCRRWVASEPAGAGLIQFSVANILKFIFRQLILLCVAVFAGCQLQYRVLRTRSPLMKPSDFFSAELKTRKPGFGSILF